MHRPKNHQEVIRTPAAAIELTRRLAADHTNTQIAEQLNGSRTTAGTGGPFKAGHVQWIRWRHKISYPASCARDGERTVNQIADAFDVSAGTVYDWITTGKLLARRGPADRLYIPFPQRRAGVPPAGRELRSHRTTKPQSELREVQYDATVSTVRDRIVQTAAKLVLEPIFEADLVRTSYGFQARTQSPGRHRAGALLVHAPRSYEWVIEGDVEDCFGSIHHGLLLEQVRRRVTDKRVLALIRLFLAAGIMREQGSLAATPSGTPQGSGLSPLLSNIALSVLDRRFEAAWTARRWPSQRARDRANGLPSYRMIRFADDFVVLVRGTEAQAHAIKQQTAKFMAEQMRLDALAREDCDHPR